MLLPTNYAIPITTLITSLLFFFTSLLNPTRCLYNTLSLSLSKTHHCFCPPILMYSFLHFVQEMIQEQITRVLLERLIVNRPHPWGLLITFIELIKVVLVAPFLPAIILVMKPIARYLRLYKEITQRYLRLYKEITQIVPVDGWKIALKKLQSPLVQI